HTRFSRDWSSDVCSSDLLPILGVVPGALDVVAGEGADGVVGRPEREEEEVGAVAVGAAEDVDALVAGGGAVVRHAGLEEVGVVRSEERRVGRERRAEWSR